MGDLFEMSDLHAFDVNHTNTRGLALVIGNSEYQTLDYLPGVEGDVEQITQALQILRYETICIMNVTAAEMRRRITNFAQRCLETDDSCILYFSGHGGDGLLVGTDDRYVNISSEIVPILADNLPGPTWEEKPKILIFDCCRSLPPKEEEEKKSVVYRSKQPHAGMANTPTQRRNFLEICSCDRGFEADDHETFSRHFSEVILSEDCPKFFHEAVGLVNQRIRFQIGNVYSFCDLNVLLYELLTCPQCGVLPRGEELLMCNACGIDICDSCLTECDELNSWIEYSCRACLKQCYYCETNICRLEGDLDLCTTCELIAEESPEEFDLPPRTPCITPQPVPHPGSPGSKIPSVLPPKLAPGPKVSSIPPRPSPGPKVPSVLPPRLFPPKVSSVPPIASPSIRPPPGPNVSSAALPAGMYYCNQGGKTAHRLYKHYGAEIPIPKGYLHRYNPCSLCVGRTFE